MLQYSLSRATKRRREVLKVALATLVLQKLESRGSLSGHASAQ